MYDPSSTSLTLSRIEKSIAELPVSLPLVSLLEAIERGLWDAGRLSDHKFGSVKEKR